jgi:hypothetical protein
MSSGTKDREWVGGILPFPAMVLEPAPHRPDLIVFLSVEEDLVVGTALIDPSDPEVSFGEALLQTIAEPAIGAPRRPRRLRVPDERLAAEVREAAPDIDVLVASTPELDIVLESLAASLPEGDEPSYLEHGTVGVEVVEDLFEAARLLHLAAPWKLGAEDEVLRLDIPALGVVGACVSIMGALEVAPGIAIFPSFDDFLDFLDALDGMTDASGDFALPADPSVADFGSPMLSLGFVTADELPEAMRREADGYGWRVAGPSAYPWVQNRARDGVMEPVGERGLQIIAACCGALAAFVPKHARLFSLDDYEPVCESYVNEDEVEVRLTLPYGAWSLFAVNDPPSL